MLTRERVLYLLNVNIDAGRMFWKNPTKYHPRLKGMEAGCARAHHSGKWYWIIKIDGDRYTRGHLIYLVAHGHFPHPMVDHKNGDSLDDSCRNLRQATVLQNAWNHKAHARRIQLPMGVRIVAWSGRYQARIGYRGKMFHLGTYDTPEEASIVYRARRKELYREWA